MTLQLRVDMHPKHRSCTEALCPDVVDATADAAKHAVDGVRETRVTSRIRMYEAVDVAEAFALETVDRRRSCRCCSGSRKREAIVRSESLVEIAQHDHLLHATSPLDDLRVKLVCLER